MGILSFLNGGGSTNTTTPRNVEYVYIDTADVRAGMWAITEAGVGIVVGPNRIVLTDADGTNKMVLEGDKAVVMEVEVDEIVQACIEDIPECRRGTEDAMLSYGYKHRGVA